MTDKINVVSSYGWGDGTANSSLAYLTEPVIRELQRFGARKILDLGCGNGAFSHYLQKQGFEVVGCDIDKQGISIASSSKESEAIFRNIGVYDQPESLEVKDFCAVVSTEVIEHLFFPAALPRFSRAVLKQGGYLIISTPYHGFIKNLLICLTGKWDSHHNPLWDGGHIKFWSFGWYPISYPHTPKS